MKKAEYKIESTLWLQLYKIGYACKQDWKKNVENISDQFVKEKCIGGVSFKKSCTSYKVICTIFKIIKIISGMKLFFFSPLGLNVFMSLMMS